MADVRFTQEHPLEKRKEVAAKIKEKYPDRCPVIVERADNSDAPLMDKKKFLVPQDITVAKFVAEIRKHMPKLKPEDSIFLFVRAADDTDILPPSFSAMAVIYEKHKSPDGFLYIRYSGENTFGDLNC